MKRPRAYASLRDYLDGERIKQKALAKRANVTQTHMSMIIRGERTPSLPLALKLARLANIPVEALVGKLHTDNGA